MITSREFHTYYFGYLKSIAERYLPQVSKAIVTVPSCYSDARRQALKDAALAAGIVITRTIDKPAAALFGVAGINIDKSRIWASKVERIVAIVDINKDGYYVDMVKEVQGVYKHFATHRVNTSIAEILTQNIRSEVQRLVLQALKLKEKEFSIEEMTSIESLVKVGKRYLQHGYALGGNSMINIMGVNITIPLNKDVVLRYE